VQYSFHSEPLGLRVKSRAQSVRLSQIAPDPPENLVSFWYGPANLLDIEIQGSHSEQQKIRLAGTQIFET
jgi:hypothetical protein